MSRVAWTPTTEVIEGLVASCETNDVEARLLRVLEVFHTVILSHEDDYRRALWVYLDTWLKSRRQGATEPPALRAGRRMRWLEKVIEPLGELPPDRRRRLLAALSLTIGIDSLVIMKDVCGLGGGEAMDVLAWTAAALLKAEAEEGTS